MIINHNIAALNTHRQLSSATGAQSKSMEKLASGLRINKAGDDAAGLAISEKMRGQIRGLDQASKNSQDGISMIATAEGALNETHDILQRMRELATQASNDTNVGVDRGEIQKEINQLTSEINRVGNTTEFNTQSLLKGDGGVALEQTGVFIGTSANGGTAHTEAKATIDFASGRADATTKIELAIGGKNISIEFDAADATTITDATGKTSEKSAELLKDKINQAISADADLQGQFTVAYTADSTSIEIKAVAGGTYEGSKGAISQATVTGTGSVSTTSTAGVGSTANTAATGNIDLSSIDTKVELEALLGKGFEIDGQKIEFYNVNDGAYKGDAIGVDISKALETADGGTQQAAALIGSIVNQVGDKLETVNLSAGTTGNLTITSKATGIDSKFSLTDGATKDNFKASFQVGANQGQSMTIEIADMRANALKITGKAGTDGFTKTDSVTDGTNNTNKEAALDVSNHENASAAIKVINDAIETVSAQRSNLGASQNRLEHTINNLNTSSENLTAAESRIRDVDMAKEMMEQTKNSILSQAAQAMLAQSNQMPQGVLQLLR